ncbi:MAG TPA: DUF4160 domain-containing protein [Bacteroidia bacterium]|nr:DUF4160 domain-containing protein [Bacteroidia bacterium]
MPTVLRIRSFRFHFYSDERNEPPHIHVATPEGECKFWLSPVMLASSRNVAPHVVREMEKLVYENRGYLIEKYEEIHKQ